MTHRRVVEPAPASESVRSLLTAGAVMAAGVLVCIARAPKPLDTTDGLSYFGVTRATLVEYALTVLVTAALLVRAAAPLAHVSELRPLRVVLLVLKSPQFLYRELDGGSDGYDVASRLSFGLWDSLPDAELLREAAAGRLATRERVTRQAERMLADPRAQAKVRDFLLLWLRVDQDRDLSKDPKQYPGFDTAAASDLRTSLELFLNQVVWSEKSDYRDLLLFDKVFLNGRLAKLYGVNLPPDAPFQPVALDSDRRAGVLTHPYLMASFAYMDSSSPIHRSRSSTINVASEWPARAGS